jgi:hypothetical protein
MVVQSMTLRGISACLCLILLLILGPRISGQSAIPTTDILSRVFMIQTQFGRGTIFTIDVDDREYWITAKHMFTGAEHPPYGAITTQSVTFKMLDAGAPGEKWIDENFTVIEIEKDVDIVVLAPPMLIMQRPPRGVLADAAGTVLGGDCEFLGFPYGGGWHTTIEGKPLWLPFVKHCTVSAMLGLDNAENKVNEDKKLWILDGINNVGFSGGPVIFRTGTEQKIMAVISGYVLEPSEVVNSGSKLSAPPIAEQLATPKGKVNVNSGFMVAFDISYAVQAARKNPIGPLRNPQ